MRWLALGVSCVLGAWAAPADALCLPPYNVPFRAGEQVETNPPSELEIGAVLIRRSEDPPKGVVPECSPSTLISVEVAASDDTTPSDQLGVRVVINEHTGDQIPNITGSSFGLIIIRFQGNDYDLAFDLRLAAIDSSGNLGPETTIPIHSDAPGCNAGGNASLLLGGAAALLFLRRRSRR